MKKILILDFETTGVDPAICKPIEFAGILCNEALVVISSDSFLINQDVEIAEEIEELTGISTSLLQSEGISPEIAKQKIQEIINEADILVAHNGLAFDFKILQNIGIIFTGKLLVDTLVHIDYPKSVRCKKLECLCGITDAHRALADCKGLCDLIVKFGLEKTLERAKQKVIKAIAQVGYAEKDKAKNAGFGWNGKDWIKEVLECDLQALISKMKKENVSLKILA